jgi:SAM-dependent methyltransferase
MASDPLLRPGGREAWPGGPEPELIPPLVDDAAIAALTDIYRHTLPAGGAILDLACGWMSHLPPEIAYARVVGIGDDACALAENPFLDEWRVQDLNADPRLPFAAGAFDGAALCAALPRLTRPIEVIREVGRVLKPGAPLVVTFSNRFPAGRRLACWHLLDDAGQLCLIVHYFAEAGNWTDIRCLHRTLPGGGDPLYAVAGRSLGPAPD